MDYGKTLNLPKTDFSMRANLPVKEPETLKKWEAERLYDGLMEKNAGKPVFVLHDGPPYANGDIHLGHTMNKILKDLIVRYKNMSGFRAPYVPGWDTHGLPIEKQAMKALGITPHEAGVSKFRQKCGEFADKYVNNQREQFKRLGVIGDWEHPYLTKQPEFEAKQIEMFGEMAKKGFIYKGLKPVYWCADCQTALAEAEIEYQDDDTVSIYVKFKVTDDKGLFADIKEEVYFVIWTTTTWTLPANMAVCLNENFEYSLVKNGNEAYVIASDLVDEVCKTAGIADYSVIKTVQGSELEYMTCQHPFLLRQSLVILGDHVTLEAGTGCVHTAPGHGMEDFDVCQKYDNIETVVPVDAKGYLTEEAGPFAGLFYEKANGAILERLEADGTLLAKAHISHSYPHCWRCKEPIIYRATEQWFASVKGFKEEALREIEKVEWLPAWGEERIKNMVQDRNDWCISRQRVWGVPIPIFYCKDCGKELITDETIQKVADLFREKGSNAWFEMTAEEILGSDFVCECGCKELTKETDIMDVWFDSGSSNGAVLQQREDLQWPADLYLEGNDQYRGWFQSSLLVSVANTGKAPYKSVLTHGMLIDLEGNKMSKSKGNGIDPQDVIKKYGADILRMWIASADYRSDVKISNDILKQLSEGYRKIRNTARYILGNISDFNPETDMVPYEKMEELDQWALLKLNHLVERARQGYDNYEFHVVYHSLHNFCVVDLSNFYLDIIKDRLYTEKADSQSRRSGQTAMYLILDALVRIMSPILAFTSEEIWAAMPHHSGDDLTSILYNDMPEKNDQYVNEPLEQKYDKLLDVRSDVAKALESARNEKVIGSSLAAKVSITASGEMAQFLKANEDILPMIFIASQVELTEGEPEEKSELTGIGVKVQPAEGEKCQRCWMFTDSVGSHGDHPELCDRCAEVVADMDLSE
ncbi:MAG: isoleucine--tRNA ligase [Clostridia bacterium]|nr:isoleucine--tRNA ligase [Clostridia bacterium]